MNIFVSGQKTFGASVLRMLIERGHNIVGASSPGPSAERDPMLMEAEIRRVKWIDSYDLDVNSLPDNTDLIVCAHSHAFLGRKTRQKARIGAIGYHPSLLPRHRGRDSVKWAVKMNDPITGGTVFWLDNGVDTGDIAAQEWCWIDPGMDASTLWRKRLFPLGLILIERVVNEIAAGKIVRYKQREANATFEPAMDPPRLHRPELPQLCEQNNGFRFIVESELDKQIAGFTG